MERETGNILPLDDYAKALGETAIKKAIEDKKIVPFEISEVLTIKNCDFIVKHISIDTNEITIKGIPKIV